MKEENLHGSVWDLRTPDPVSPGRLLCFHGDGCGVTVGTAEIGFSETHTRLKSTFLFGPKQEVGLEFEVAEAGSEPGWD